MVVLLELVLHVGFVWMVAFEALCVVGCWVCLVIWCVVGCVGRVACCYGAIVLWFLRLVVVVFVSGVGCVVALWTVGLFGLVAFI